MRNYAWQFLIITGVILIAIKLFLDLLIPAGVILIVLGVVFYFVELSQAPKVIKK